MHPKPVCRLEIGHFRDRQSHSGALHPDLDFGTGEIKGCVLSTG